MQCMVAVVAFALVVALDIASGIALDIALASVLVAASVFVQSDTAFPYLTYNNLDCNPELHMFGSMVMGSVAEDDTVAQQELSGLARVDGIVGKQELKVFARELREKNLIGFLGKKVSTG